jgi:serpin B
MQKFLFPLVLIAFLVQGCGSDNMKNRRKPSGELTHNSTSSEKKLISNVNAFSYDIFHHLAAADSTGNVFLSPLSISIALGMTLNGAAGDTKNEIAKTLNMSGEQLQAVNRFYKGLIDSLMNMDSKVEMNIANSLWSRKGFAVKQSFKDTLQTDFNAQVQALDFRDPSAKKTINNWVKKQTGGRIQKIISGDIPPSMMLYLINAVYFKGTWLYKFDPDKTHSAPFHLDHHSTVKVPMMHRKAPLAVYSSEQVKMAQLAYGDSLYQMDILMPANPHIPIAKFVHHSLTAGNVDQWTDSLTSKKEKIAMPKFDIRYKKTLNSVLKAMGMRSAFNKSKADFSKISDQKRLFISKVLHKANITVDEQGSEAAAVTSVGMRALSVHFGFRANRPFVYMIRDRSSGTILFMGVMRNPAE